MKTIINGGVYRVDFIGSHPCEFTGPHPTLVIRTLRESDMYIAVPLTSYTPYRWERCRKKGFGTRILSSNSIARIDKFKIVHKNDINNRWKTKTPSKNIQLTSSELDKVIQKLN